MAIPIPPASASAPTAVAGNREAEPIAALLESTSPESTSITTDGFAKVVNHALDTASGLDYSADSAVVQKPAGELQPPSDLKISGTEAEETSDLTMANRGRALAAFNEILTMQM